MTTKSVEVDEEQHSAKKYSICTLVTNRDLYEKMTEKFITAGFTNDVANYVYVDNTRHNKYDGYEGVRKLIESTAGDYIIICHEDVEPIDTIDQLENCIGQLDAIDPQWAFCGNAGGIAMGKLAIRITDPKGKNRNIGGPFPRKVMSLDENFILTKRSTSLTPSRDLSGFHFYGTDLCLQGHMKGWNSYVIDFHLRHEGGASRTNQSTKSSDRNLEFHNSFVETKNRLIDKYSNLLGPRWIQTPNARLFVCGNRALRFLGNRKLVCSIVRRIVYVCLKN